MNDILKVFRVRRLHSTCFFAIVFLSSLYPLRGHALTGNEALTLALIDVVYYTTPAYDGTDETLPVRAYAFLDGGDHLDFDVYIQNKLATYGGYDAAANIHYWYDDLSLGPSFPPAWNGGAWPINYPFRQYYTNYNRRFLPVVAELYLKSSSGLASGFVDRAMDTMIDGRAAGFGYGSGGSIASSSLGAQLTPAGLEKLSESHGKSTPARIDNLRNYLDNLASLSTPVTAETSPRLCVPLNDAPVEFQDTDAFSDAIEEARGQYITWETADTACTPNTPFACAVAEAICVRKPDVEDPKYYKVCVDSLSALMTSHTFDDVDNVEIEFGGLASPSLSSSAVLSGERGLFDVSFEEVEIKWDRAPGVCAAIVPFRPAKDLTTEAMDDIEVLADWRTCENLEVHIDKTCTDCTPIDYPTTGADSYVSFIEVDVNDREQLSISDSGQGLLGFSDISYVTNLEACGESYWRDGLDLPTNIDNQIRPLLEGVLPILNSDINHAWIGDNPDFEYTETLDELIRPYEVGTTTIEPDDIALDHRFNRCIEGIDGGLACDYDSSLTAATGGTVTGWLKTPSGYSTGAPAFSEDGNLPTTNIGFDGSVLITTNLLNQHVEARYRDSLTFSYVPSYEQLSQTPPAGVASDDPVPQLTGDLLGNVAGTFTQYGSDVISILVRPTDLKPFVWMQPDAPLLDTTLTGHAPQLDFIIRVNNQTIMKAYLSLTDENMTTEFQRGPEQLVNIRLDNHVFAVLAYDSSIPGCAISALSELSACEKTTIGQLALLVVPELVERFNSLFKGVVAPQVFNQGGDFAASVGLTTLATLNRYNTVGLYGKFEEGCHVPDYTLPSGEWHQITMPCQPMAGEDTVQAVLGDDIDGEYGTDWIVFLAQFSGVYLPLAETSVLAPGLGYWIFQESNDDAMLDMPLTAVATQSIQTEGCVTTGGCLPVLMRTNGADVGWSMTGNSFDRPIALDGVRIKTNDMANCAVPEVCAMDEANSESVVLNIAYRFQNGAYAPLREGDDLGPWHAAWWATYPDTATSIPRLLFPVK